MENKKKTKPLKKDPYCAQKIYFQINEVHFLELN